MTYSLHCPILPPRPAGRGDCPGRAAHAPPLRHSFQRESPMQLDEHFQRRLNEARMFFAEGKALAAEKIYRDLLKTRSARRRPGSGSGRPRALSAPLQGRLEEAETFFRASLRFLEELFGPNHIHVAGGLQNLARASVLSGENVKRPQRSANGRSTFLSKTCPPTICASPTHC